VKPPIGILVVVLTALLSVAAACAEPPGVDPLPLPEAQAGIDRLVVAIGSADRKGPDREIPEMAEQLQREIGDREALVLQIVLYLADHPGNEQAMGAALLIDYYRFSDAEKVAALAPHAGATDDRLRDAIWELLSTVAQPPGAGDSAARVKELERLLASETDGPHGSDQARREIDALSRDAAWWVRLYVARVVHARPELGSTEIVERLRADDQPRVREAAGG